jgi:uncharacterized repeat protein (TIGR02543 family)
MSIPASIRRKYLSNLLAIVLAVSGLQAIAISSAPTASALTWTDVTGPTGRAKDWQHIRTNNDGSVIGVVSLGAIQGNIGDLYLSRDSGASWTYTTQPTNNYYGLYRLAISGNGNIAIAADDSYIVKATYSGSAWSYSTSTWSSAGSGTNQRCAGYGPNFNSLASSTDGSNWVAGARDEGCVYSSSDSGANWSNANIGGTNFGSAISAIGTIRVTANSNGNIYRNEGTGWSAISTSGLPASPSWGLIACDSTCTKMVIAGRGTIYRTSDSGANWSDGNAVNINAVDISMSSDGNVIAMTNNSDIYISKDSGATWSGQGQGGKTWTGVTVSGDGRKIYAAASDGTIRKAEILATQTITFNDPLDMTFGGADQAITASSSSGLTVTLASSTTSVCTIVSNSIRIVTAGTCTITANQAGDSLYAAAAQVTNSVTISKASSSISASGSTTFTYSGLPQGPASSTVIGSAGAVTYSYVGIAPTTYTASATKPTNAGSYSVTATVATDTNYLSASSAPHTFTISKSALEITASSPTVIYGAAKPTIGATYAGLVNSEAGTTVVTGLSCDTVYTTASPVGSLPATNCSGGTAVNYSISYFAGSVTINSKALTISGLTGVNKEFDRGLAGTATGTPTLVGVVGSDDVLPGGIPTFTFASANVANGITVTASGYTLTGTTASNYTLTQPTVTANITAKAARVAATNTTVAFGAPITSGVTATGLISPDAIGSASYTYTGTGTSTPPTAVGVYTVTPSSAVLSSGLIGNYTISYDTATVTILAKYTITYNANGGQVSGGSTSSVDFVVGDTALTLPTPTRVNYTFTGWYTLQTNGVQVTGAYTPTATATLWAHWVQNSLYGMGANTKILTITTLAGVGNTYSANAAGGTIAIEYLADALAVGTVIDAYVLSDTSTATSLIGSGNDYVMSLVIAWVHPITGLVETTAAGKPIIMTITNSVIKKGAKIYSVIGTTPTLLTTATADGIAIISITDDPQIIIAITKPDAPTGVTATSGENATSTVSWTAPSDGGSAITGYTATSNAGQTCSSATTSCSVTGLTNGTPYTFTVTARNSIGMSDLSAPSSAITPLAPTAPVVAPQNSGGGGGYVAPAPEPAPTVDPAVAAAAAAAAKALAEKVAAEAKAVAEAKAAADAKALADKKAAEEAELLATLKALQEKADAEALAAAKRAQEELAAAQLKAEEELKAAAALKLAEEQRIATALAAAKRITTVYSTSAAFKLNKTYTKRLDTYTKRIASGSTVTCIGYAKSSKTLTYAKAKVVATNQAKALCLSMKKINPTLKTKSIVYPASKAPKTTVNKKWIPVSYRVAIGIN